MGRNMHRRISLDGFMTWAIMHSTDGNRFEFAKVGSDLELTAQEIDEYGRALELAGRIHCPFGTEWVIVGVDADEAAAWRAKKR
jgi:hypothetical protein